jgi:hypothetical protein
MRATLLVILVMSGCATARPRYTSSEPAGRHCLVDRIDVVSGNAGSLDETLYLQGRRVPDNDVVAATALDERANVLAERAVQHHRLGIGGLLLGGVLLAPGAGLIGFGVDHDQHAALGIGGALTATGAGVLLASMILVERGGVERQRAIVAYDQDLDASCR